jgi:hypothetical protein
MGLIWFEIHQNHTQIFKIVRSGILSNLMKYLIFHPLTLNFWITFKDLMQARNLSKIKAQRRMDW